MVTTEIAERRPDPSEITENRKITCENVEAYACGCSEMGVRLHSVIERVSEAGKRPVILIPSRGAIPIFLLARREVNELDPVASYLADRNARFYPEGVFDYLEGRPIPKERDTLTTVDVILYPFTADVSLEPKDDETLARRLRASCARAVIDLVYGGDTKSYDLAWYEFLMKKLRETGGRDKFLNPSQVLKSLESYPKPDNPQIILIDTVISGRAANDITQAFQALGHPVVPILAVDSTKGGKFQPKYKAKIGSTVPWELMPEEGPFVRFPLITEDKGAALLGVVATNFINFNNERIFAGANGRLPEHFLPQSCVWTLPPSNVRKMYLGNFRKFLDLAWKVRNGQIKREAIDHFRENSELLTESHPRPSQQEMAALVQVSADTEVKETSSHIISLKLPGKQAQQWLAEFTQSNGYSAP